MQTIGMSPSGRPLSAHTAAGSSNMPNGTALVGSPSLGNHAAAEMMRSASNAQQLLAGAAAAGTSPAAAAAAGQQGMSPSVQHQQQPKLPVATRADMLADTGKVSYCTVLCYAVLCHGFSSPAYTVQTANQ